MTPAVLPCRDQLAASLRRWRALNRVKQSALADEMGVSQTTVSRWETGVLAPGTREEDRLMRLLAARPNSAADGALLDLVRNSPKPAHLMCDLTHRLFAASPARISGWRVGIDELAGKSLWRFASPGIAAGEAALDAFGWYAPLAPAVLVDTEYADFDELTIAAGRLRYTRMPLSDGFDKLETMLQHLIGRNGADFDYAFNLTYGAQHTVRHPLLFQIRELVDAATRERIAACGTRK